MERYSGVACAWAVPGRPDTFVSGAPNVMSGVKLLLCVPLARGARVFVAHGSPYVSMTRPYLKYVE